MIVVTISQMLRCSSRSSVMGEQIATSAAAIGQIPCKVRHDAKLIALRQNNLTRLRLLRQYLPVGFVRVIDGSEPNGGVSIRIRFHRAVAAGEERISSRPICQFGNSGLIPAQEFDDVVAAINQIVIERNLLRRGIKLTTFIGLDPR